MSLFDRIGNWLLGEAESKKGNPPTPSEIASTPQVPKNTAILNEDKPVQRFQRSKQSKVIQKQLDGITAKGGRANRKSKVN